MGHMVGRLIAGAIVVLVTGCTVAGAATVGPSGAPVPSGADHDFVHEGDTPVIVLDRTEAGVDGVRGRDTVQVFGDGTVIRSGGRAFGYETLTLAIGGVETLVADADRLGLLVDPDFGEPGISDTGWDTVRFAFRHSLIDLRVYAPGYHGNLTSAQQEARAGYATFVSRVDSLIGIPLQHTVSPYTPAHLLVLADRVAPVKPGDDERPTPVAWPLNGTPAALLDGASCAEVSGSDAARMLRVASQNTFRPSVDVVSGLTVPERLRLTLQIRLPGESGCPGTNVSTMPVPGAGLRPASAVERWVAADAVDRAADAGRFGPDAANRARVSHYSLQSWTTTGSGPVVVEVTGRPYSDRGKDPAGFTLRVEVATGRILTLTQT